MTSPALAAAADTADLADFLAAAPDRAMFLDVCREILSATGHVRLNVDALAPVARRVAGAEPVSWSWYLRAPDAELDQAAFDLVAMAAPNGGYFYTHPDGSVRQWAQDGSGAKALAAWTDALRADGLMPGVDIHDPAAARAALEPRVAGLPFAETRLQIAAELADPRRRRRLRQLLDATRDAEGRWLLTLETADHLASIYPAGFGEDPFRKKALLALIMLHGHLVHAGLPTRLAVPVPSDYQLPRILMYLGVLRPSPALTASLRGHEMMRPEDSRVMALRAGAAVACAQLAEMTGLCDGVIDGALFIPYRKDPVFQRDSLPAMRCETLWF